MSGICGLLSRTGEPLAPEHLAGMVHAMDFRNADGAGTWLNGVVGLGHVSRPCSVESVGEKQPIATSGEVILTCTARLDNRDELSDRLGVPGPERAAITDAALILRSFQEWGGTCPARLLGDFSFGIWCGREKRLLVVRGCDTTAGLYYHLSPTLFAFASSLRALLALPAVPKRLNEARIAQVLTGWFGDGQETAYQGIRRFPVAHSMSVEAGRVDVKRYWQPGERPELRLRSDDEYVDALLDVYSEAVRCRLRHVRPVGVALSSGLDSTSIAALAAPLMARKNQRLPAFTSVPIYPLDTIRWKSVYGNERDRVELTARHLGNVDTSWVTAEGTTPLTGLSVQLAVYGQPEAFCGNAFWFLSMLEMARQQGVGALLIGQFGNATVSWKGAALDTIAVLARTGRWRRLAKEAHHCWVHNRPGWRALLRPLVPEGVLAAYRSIRGRTSVQATAPGWTQDSFVLPDFAYRTRAAEHVTEEDADYASGRSGLIRLMPKAMHQIGCLFQEHAARSGIDLWDPTSDRRVLDFCLAIPSDQYFSLGLDRWLMRRAMARLLPSDIALNRQRGLQASDLGSRLQLCGADLLRTLERLDTSPLAQAYLDVEKMRRCVVSLLASERGANEHSSMEHLLRAFQVGMFLIAFGETNGRKA